MRLLDLFCGGGGAARGYHDAGFEVVGMDAQRQPNYPYEFVRGDAIAALDRLTLGYPLTREAPYRLADFDAIHASPPCQIYTRKTAPWGRARTHVVEHPDLVDEVRLLLRATKKPYVIENVIGAPLDGQLLLCGSMFGLAIQKHRVFESNVDLGFPPASCVHKDMYNPWQGAGRSAVKMREAMGIDWLPISGGASRKAGYTGDLFNAIPPAYTEYIGKELLRALEGNP
jgi:DNA (cytosine-5)-methyltransferase 1